MRTTDMVWEYTVSLWLVPSVHACRICGRREDAPVTMVMIHSRPKGGKEDSCVNRYCVSCYKAMVSRAHDEGELRGLPLEIKPSDEPLSITVPAYIVMSGDVLVYWKPGEKEKEK